MASRDRIVIRLPPELHYVLRLCQNGHRVVSLSATIQRLLETHPEVVEMAENLYDLRSGADLPRT